MSSIEAIPLRLEGTFVLTSLPAPDCRGYFSRCWDSGVAQSHRLNTDWVQENECFNYKRGTLRGLHFQTPPYTETKLLRVSAGAVLDVFVDLRKASETYGQWDSIELSAENGRLVYIPKGFAHGFCTLTDNVVVLYKVDEYYAPEFEGGVRWDDPDLGIRWPVLEPILSARDAALPTFYRFQSPF